MGRHWFLLKLEQKRFVKFSRKKWHQPNIPFTKKNHRRRWRRHRLRRDIRWRMYVKNFHVQLLFVRCLTSDSHFAWCTFCSSIFQHVYLVFIQHILLLLHVVRVLWCIFQFKMMYVYMLPQLNIISFLHHKSTIISFYVCSFHFHHWFLCDINICRKQSAKWDRKIKLFMPAISLVYNQMVWCLQFFSFCFFFGCVVFDLVASFFHSVFIPFVACKMLTMARKCAPVKKH